MALALRRFGEVRGMNLAQGLAAGVFVATFAVIT